MDFLGSTPEKLKTEVTKDDNRVQVYVHSINEKRQAVKVY